MKIRQTAARSILAAACAAVPQLALAVGPGVPTTGPDVTISVLTGVGGCTASSCGGSNPTAADGYRSYSVGTTSCNIGDTPVNWCDSASGCGGGTMDDSQHPVIAQGIYRLHGGRFEQIGMSWLKHGFLSTNSNEAQCKNGTPSCISPPHGGDQLGVGCNDTYGTSLNGSRPLGLRSEVNATTGVFPFPETNVAPGAVYEQRIKVLESDLNTTTFPGAVYFAEAQYIADNDAASGNGLNNASYRKATVNQTSFAISLVETLVRERTAIHGWAAADAAVHVHNVDVPGDIVERFEVARKVTALGGGVWHYEYAIRNMNSDRSGQAFTVDFADGTAITNVGFKDIEHHSGEPYSTTDWVSTVNAGAGSVNWATETFATNDDANALRWATMFNFWFDAAAAPGAELHTLGLFKPGTPTSVSWQWPLFNDGFEAHNLVAWSSLAP